MKLKLLIAAILLSSVCLAQKRQERPKIHAEFYFGSFPTAREAAETMADEKARLLMVGLHQGWDTLKIAKETRLSEDELDMVFYDLEQQRLAGAPDDEERRPFIPVFRDRDMERVGPGLARHSQDYGALIEANWGELETVALSFKGAASVPKGQLMYDFIVSGILLDGMQSAFESDKTIMPPGPRRSKGQRFFAWLAEGDPKLAGLLKQEVRESDSLNLITVGPTFSTERVDMDDIRSAHGWIIDDAAEARKFRSFVGVFCRDKLLPFFKKNRSDFLKTAGQVESVKYTAFAEFFSWYYNQMANAVTDRLVASGRVTAPTAQYTYAIRVPAQ